MLGYVYRSHRMGRLYRLSLPPPQGDTTTHLARVHGHPTQTGHRETSSPRVKPGTPQRRTSTFPRRLPRDIQHDRPRRAREGPTNLVVGSPPILPIRSDRRPAHRSRIIRNLLPPAQTTIIPNHQGARDFPPPGDRGRNRRLPR